MDFEECCFEIVIYTLQDLLEHHVENQKMFFKGWLKNIKPVELCSFGTLSFWGKKCDSYFLLLKEAGELKKKKFISWLIQDKYNFFHFVCFSLDY